MDHRYLVVDLGGTRVRTAVAGDEVHLLGRVEEATDVAHGPQGVVDQVARMAQGSVQESHVDWAQIACAAVAAPGPLIPRTGMVFSPPNMPGWGEVPLQAMLEQKLHVPVTLVNDANAGALGEFVFGAGRGGHNLVYLTISTGIGGGVVVDDRLLEGSAGVAGELGHMTIDRHGPRCNCGNIGCLEAIASGTAIGRRFEEARATGAPTSVTERPATAADVARAAAAGDELARSIFSDAAEAIGAGIVSFINIFDPDVVVLGGGVSRAGPLLFAPIRQVVARRVMSVPGRTVRIVPAELGEDVGLLGAAAVARMRC